MGSRRPDQSGWTTEDRAFYARWRKVVCIGSLCLLPLAGLASYAAQRRQPSVMVASVSAPTQDWSQPLRNWIR
jgi:hypothetical protein